MTVLDCFIFKGILPIASRTSAVRPQNIFQSEHHETSVHSRHYQFFFCCPVRVQRYRQRISEPLLETVVQEFVLERAVFYSPFAALNYSAQIGVFRS
jgi:hypothetical protein